MKKIITMILLILGCFLLQSTVFAGPAFGGIVPNLLLVLTATYGFMYGDYEGLLVGFFCGLLIDIFYADIIGGYALIYMVIGFCNGKFSGIFYPEDIKLPIGLIVGSDLLYSMVCYFFLFLLRGRFHLSFYFSNVMLPEMIYTIVVTLFLYPLILWLNGMLGKRHRRSDSDFV